MTRNAMMICWDIGLRGCGRMPFYKRGYDCYADNSREKYPPWCFVCLAFLLLLLCATLCLVCRCVFGREYAG